MINKHTYITVPKQEGVCNKLIRLPKELNEQIKFYQAARKKPAGGNISFHTAMLELMLLGVKNREQIVPVKRYIYDFERSL